MLDLNQKERSKHLAAFWPINIAVTYARMAYQTSDIRSPLLAASIISLI